MLSTGCQQSSNKPLVPDQKTNTNTSLTASDKRVMASRFSTLAENVDGVQTATVVVDKANTVQGRSSKIVQTNDTVAMVGITLDDSSLKGTDRERTIKETVRKKILDSDKKLSEVLITTDANMIKKIKDVAAGVISGKMTSTYAKDVNELNTMLKGK